MDAIYPYIKSAAVFHCPDDSGGFPTSVGNSTGKYIPYQQLPGKDSTNYGSYGLNSAYFSNNVPKQYQGPGNKAGGQGSAGTGGFKLSQLVSPATVAWAFDSDDIFHVAWDDVPNPAVATINGVPALGGQTRSPKSATENGDVVFRHNGQTQSNALWCDGHVKAVTSTTLLQTNGAGYLYLFTVQGS